MKLYFANKTRSYVPFGNFGDDLNPWIWDRLLPGFFQEEENPSSVFVGFGTLLNHKLPKFKKTIIFGTGYGFGDPPQMDETWKIYCVRGPLTTNALSLSPELGIADPAIWVNRLYRPEDCGKRHSISLIPYAWEMNSSPEVFQELCQKLGFFCIDPRWPVEQVLKEINSSKLILTAAMHGAIVADALRVPWISFKSNAGIPDLKWTDFCMSLELEYEPKRLYRFSRFSKSFPKYKRVEIEIMALFLKRLLKNNEPQLSKDQVLERKLDALEEKMEQFKKDIENGLFDN